MKHTNSLSFISALMLLGIMTLSPTIIHAEDTEVTSGTDTSVIVEENISQEVVTEEIINNETLLSGGSDQLAQEIIEEEPSPDSTIPKDSAKAVTEIPVLIINDAENSEISEEVIVVVPTVETENDDEEIPVDNSTTIDPVTIEETVLTEQEILEESQPTIIIGNYETSSDVFADQQVALPNDAINDFVRSILG